MIGKRIRLTDSDNEVFGEALRPDGAVGALTMRLSLDDWGDDWYLLQLDKPVVYQGVSQERLLIRSRAVGHIIGESKPTPVFVLLIPDSTVLEKPRLVAGDFYHVSWCMAHTDALA